MGRNTKIKFMELNNTGFPHPRQTHKRRKIIQYFYSMHTVTVLTEAAKDVLPHTPQMAGASPNIAPNTRPRTRASEWLASKTAV